jgi:hypothetical protein
MNTAEQILVIMLSTALAIFLLLAIVLVVKLIDLVKEIKKIAMTGQDIAANIEDMTSVGGLVKLFVNKFNSNNKRSGQNDKKT